MRLSVTAVVLVPGRANNDLVNEPALVGLLFLAKKNKKKKSRLAQQQGIKRVCAVCV